MPRRPAGPVLVAVVALLAGVTAACGSSAGGSGGSGGVDGVWQTVGYGRILVIADGRMTPYETTSVSCLAGDELDAVGGAGADGATGFGSDDQVDQTVRVTGPGRATLRELGTAADIDLVPLPALPDRCTRTTPDDPVTTFDVFLATFAEQYNATTARRVDWAAVRDRYRPQVSADTPPDQLFRILTDVLRPLGDAHVELDGGDDRSFSGLRPGTRDDVDGATDAIDRHLRENLGVRDLQTWARGAITYADLPDGRGYLRFTSFDGWGRDAPGFAGRERLLAQVLDEVVTDQRVRSWRGLVLDLSANGGGDDQLGLELAGRLTDVPYTAYTKRARTGSPDPDDVTPPRVVTVQPTPGRPHWTGPVRVLTSDLSVSAAETTTVALMGRTPAPQRVGATTQGVFSDVQERTLPNGWTVGLGNETFTAPDGTDYEGRGIPPDVEVPMFTPDQLSDGAFPALDVPGPA